MHQDNWSLKAKKMGYRSRAVFKLEEILLKLHKNQINKVLDLGSAPGGWSQFIINKYPNSKIIAVDILHMEPIEGVQFIKKNIEDIDSIQLINSLKGKFDLVISDIAPNLTGISAVDNENIYELNKITINLANIYLSEASSAVVIKTFQNSNFKSLKKEMELFFKIVQTYKPAASKNKSAGTYLYGAR